MSEQIVPTAKGVADIVFLVDATGSMKPCIEGLKQNILGFVETLSGKDPNNECPVRDWRIKVAGYRDAEDDPSTWWVDFPFTRSIDEVKTHFAALEARGGGDEAESLLDALYKLGAMPAAGPQETDPPDKWRDRRSARRVIVVFTDATFKTTMSAPECKGGGFEDVKNVIHGNKIVLSVFCPEHDCYHDLAALDRSEVEFIGSVSDAAKLMTEFTRDQENFKRTLSALAKSISKSAEVPIL